MSQQGLSIAIIGNAVDMGDLEYIEGKVLSGDYFQVSGDINAINDTIEFIVPNLKTAFLIEASVRILSEPSALHPVNTYSVATNKITASLKIDTVEKDRIRPGDQHRNYNGAGSAVTTTGGNGGPNSENFKVVGLSLIGDGIKVIEIENIADSGSGFAVMSGYTIDT